MTGRGGGRGRAEFGVAGDLETTTEDVRLTGEGVVRLEEHEARTRLFDTEARGALRDESTDAQVDRRSAISNVEDDAIVQVIFAQLNAPKNLGFIRTGDSHDLRDVRCAGTTKREHRRRRGGIGSCVGLHDGTRQIIGDTPTEITRAREAQRRQRAVTGQIDGVDL